MLHVTRTTHRAGHATAGNVAHEAAPGVLGDVAEGQSRLALLGVLLLHVEGQETRREGLVLYNRDC